MLMSEILKVDENAAVSAAAPAAKGFSRFLPGIGLAASGYDAYNRAKRGDWTGAALSGAGGLASFIPGIGTAASLGLAAANAMRDKQRTGSYLPTDDELDAANLATQPQTAQPQTAQPQTAQPQTAQPALPAGADPKVYALQQQLISKGAKIALDGKMGPQTQIAMKQFGMAEEIKENKMSNSEKMAQLRDRLKLLESEQPNTEGLADVARGAWNVGKNFVGGLGGKMAQGTAKTAAQLAASQAATNAARVAAGKKALSAAQMAQQVKTGIGAHNAASSAAKFANKAGQVIAKNPGKTALAGTALGAAGGYALGQAGQPVPTPPTNPADIANSPDANLANDPNKGAKKPGGGGQKPGPVKTDGGQKPAAGGLTPEELAELDAIAGEWENVQDPAIISLLGAYGQVRSKLGAPKGPPPVSGPATAAAPVAAQGGGAM